MTRRPIRMRMSVLVAVAVALLALAYVRDPPWLAGLTSGLAGWDRDAEGTAFRWTSGHSSFFVPSDAEAVSIPVRAVFAPGLGSPVVVRIAVNDQPVAQVALTEAAWLPVKVVCAGLPAHRRRSLRIDLRVSRARSGDTPTVQVGQVTITRRPA
jgi:hypothetical protein